MNQDVKHITYKQFKQELIDIIVKQTGTRRSEIKVNDEEARQWYNDGLSAKFCFQENWKG